MVGMANRSEITVETVVEPARSMEMGGGPNVDSGGPDMDGGGGTCDEGDRGAVEGTPDITDTRLIGFRILPGTSLNE
jgi:hypothetical protein